MSKCNSNVNHLPHDTDRFSHEAVVVHYHGIFRRIFENNGIPGKLNLKREQDLVPLLYSLRMGAPTTIGVAVAPAEAPDIL